MGRLPASFKLFFLWPFLIAVLLAAPPQQPPVKPVSNVLVVTMDGMRWQEVFGGMSRDLLTTKDGGVSDARLLEERFGGATPEQRREKLMPFFWTTVARQGQVFGDPSHNSNARVTNGLRFS